MNSSIYLERIRRAAAGNDPAAARLARYILGNSHAVTESTLQGLADASGVSYATVCRFIKHLNCGGFKTFRTILKSMPILPTGELPSPVLPSDSYLPSDPNEGSDLITNVCNLSASMTESCRRALDPTVLERIIRLLLDAGQIFIIGLGTSGVTAQYAHIKFFRLGLSCTREEDTILMRMKASLMKPGDVLFAISSSGRTRAIIETARQARDAGANVLSLCDYSRSPLSRASDIAITTTSRDSGLDPGADLPLIQGQLTLIDILYARLFRQTGGLGFAQTKDSVRTDKDL